MSLHSPNSLVGTGHGIQSTKLDQQVFDLIVCFNMFPHIIDKPSFFSKAYARLKNGGSLIICHDKPREVIVSVHTRHQVDPQISDFPSLGQIVKVLTNSRFVINSKHNQPFFFIKATKP